MFTLALIALVAFGSNMDMGILIVSMIIDCIILCGAMKCYAALNRGSTCSHDGWNEAVIAIEFALTLGPEADDFLRAWLVGDLEEWPEYKDYLQEQKEAADY